MLARPTLTKPEQTAATKPEQIGADKPKSQARPTEERFLLRVDHQTKRSFSSKEPAITAGSAIKKAFPLVMVTVQDTKDGTVEVVKVDNEGGDDGA
jgi:hypothetical protein